MARLVSFRKEMTTTIEGPGKHTGVEEYFERIAKYIPVEVVGASLAIKNLSPPPGGEASWPAWLHYAIYAVLMVLNVLYLRRIGGAVPHRARQITITCIAFLVWTYAMGGPVLDQLELDLHKDITDPKLGALLLILASLAFGIYDPDHNRN